MGLRNLALVGAGRMGQCHAAHIAAHPELRLSHIVELDSVAASRIESIYGACPAGFDEVLSDPDVAGIVICSTTSQHLPQTLAALDAGKPVFCEKPLGVSSAEVEAQRPPESSPPFLLAFNRRFDPSIVRLAEALRSGQIGKVESLRIVNHDPACPPARFLKTSGGIFLDFTIHDLDLAPWLLGEPVEEVYATGACLVDKAIADFEDFDTSRVILKFQSGALCCISNSRRSGCGYDQRIEAFGSSGRLATDNLHTSSVQTWTQAGASRSSIHPDFMTRYARSYGEEINHFANILQGRDTPRVSWQDGINALRLAEACRSSSADNTTVKLQTNT